MLTKIQLKQDPPVLAKIKCNLDLVAFLWQFVSKSAIGSLHLVHARGTMLNGYLCIRYLGLLHLETVSTVVK